MELRICEYCNMEYAATEAVCPVCARTAETAVKKVPVAVHAGGTRLASRGGKFAAKKGGARLSRTEQVYAIPTWMMIVICAILAVAVLSGALFALYSIGYFDGFIQPAVLSGEQEASDAQQLPATQEQYINEEDYQTPTTETPQAQVLCTGIKLGTTAVTFQEPEQFFNITVTILPDGCTEEVVFTSLDENVATVNQRGKIMAIGGGSTEILATCGEYTASCLVTCDFESLDNPNAQTQTPSLSSDDVKLTYPGQQVTLMVNNVPEDVEVTFVSSDEKVASVSSSGIITAVGSGVSTVTVTVGELKLDCVVRCALGDSAETGAAGDYTISHFDVTMSIKGEYFKLSLKDANGNPVSGLVWVSNNTDICTVDEKGIVTAEDKGTTTVYTVYQDVTYECIVRCAIRS